MNNYIIEKMIEERIIMLNGEIDNITASDIIRKLLYLDSLNNNDIYIYINSRGGDVIEGLAIIDTMNYIKSKVITITVGVAYSMGAIILASGEKRYALPHSEIMIHEPSTNGNGKATEILRTGERIKHMRLELANIIKTKSKKTLKQILSDMESDYFLSSKEAKEYGIIDKVINTN